MRLILIYNKMFDQDPDFSCLSETERRMFTFDRGRFFEAEAVVFHLPSLEPIDRLSKRNGQIWVLWSMESAINYPCLADEGFLRIFDVKMTYSRQADVWCSYFPLVCEWDRALGTSVPQKSETAPVVMFQSSDINRSGRVAYVKELMKNIDIDSYGRALNNRRLTEEDVGRQTKMDTIARYKFCIAMENSICEDYVTEKFFDPLLAGTVPIYLGATNVIEFAPAAGSYIDAADFPSPQKLADYLHILAQDESAYQSFFDWRRQPFSEAMRRKINDGNGAFKRLLDHPRLRPHQTQNPFKRLLRKLQARMCGDDPGKATSWAFDPGKWAKEAGPHDTPAPPMPKDLAS